MTLTECAAYPVVMLSDAWLLDAASETEFMHSGAQFSARVTSNSLSVMKETIKAGLGVGFFTPTGFVDESSAASWFTSARGAGTRSERNRSLRPSRPLRRPPC